VRRRALVNILVIVVHLCAAHAPYGVHISSHSPHLYATTYWFLRGAHNALAHPTTERRHGDVAATSSSRLCRLQASCRRSSRSARSRDARLHRPGCLSHILARSRRLVASQLTTRLSNFVLNLVLLLCQRVNLTDQHNVLRNDSLVLRFVVFRSRLLIGF